MVLRSSAISHSALIKKGLRGKAPELDTVSVREPASPIDDEVKWFREERERHRGETRPIKRTGDYEVRPALFEVFSDFGARAAPQLQLQARKARNSFRSIDINSTVNLST